MFVGVRYTVAAHHGLDGFGEHFPGVIDVGGNGLGTDVHAHEVVRNVVAVDEDGLGSLAELLGADVVDGKDDLDALLLRLLEEGLGGVDIVGLEEALADLAAQDTDEGVGHAAADDDRVTGPDEGLEDGDLAGDLAAADDGDEGLGGVLEERSHELDLLLDQEAGIAGQIVGDTLRGGVGAVGRAEGVVAIDVAVAGKGLGELGVVALLFLVEPDVLQEEDLTRLEGLDLGLDLASDDIGGELDGDAEQLLELLGDGGHGEVGVLLSLRAAEVAHDDEAGTLLEDVLDSGQSRLDPGVVGDDTVLEGNVEVDADQDSLALEVGFPDCVELHDIPLFQKRARLVGRPIRHSGFTPECRTMAGSQPLTFFMWAMRSRTLLEYPISLSYQLTTLTKVSVRAMPALASKMEVLVSPRKSEETTASSV